MGGPPAGRVEDVVSQGRSWIPVGNTTLCVGHVTHYTTHSEHHSGNWTFPAGMSCLATRSPKGDLLLLFLLSRPEQRDEKEFARAVWLPDGYGALRRRAGRARPDEGESPDGAAGVRRGHGAGDARNPRGDVAEAADRGGDRKRHPDRGGAEHGGRPGSRCGTRHCRGSGNGRNMEHDFGGGGGGDGGSGHGGSGHDPDPCPAHETIDHHDCGNGHDPEGSSGDLATSIDLLAQRVGEPEVYTPTVDLGHRFGARDPGPALGARQEIRKDLRFRRDVRRASAALSESRADRAKRDREEFEREKPSKAEVEVKPESPYPILLALGMLLLAVVVIVFLGTRK